VTTHPKTRREEYAQQTRKALVEAGGTHFAEQGYTETSIAQIAEDARVSKGAFYHHFPDKKSLLKAVLTDACDHSAVKIRETIEARSGSGDLVPAALDAAMEAIQNDSRYRDLRQQAVGVLPAAERRELDNRIRVPLVDTIFQRLDTLGELRSDVNVDAATVLVVALLDATLEEMTSSVDPQRTYGQFRPIILGFIASLTTATAR